MKQVTIISRAEQSRAEQSRAEQSRAEQSRDSSIQIIRALCIFAVICIHTCPAGFSQVIARPFINFGVGTFLFLSGYLTKEETWSSSRMWRRIKRVLIPYIIWTSIYTLLSRKPENIVYNLLTASSSAQMYYCLVYIQIVLLTGVCFRALKSRAWTILLMLVSPVSFPIKYVQIFGGVIMLDVANLVYGISFIPWIWYYVIGLKIRKHKKCMSLKILLPVWFACILLQLGEGWIWFRAGEANCGTQIKFSAWITTTIVCLICYWRIQLRRRNSSRMARWLTLIGDYSFGIYLCHIAVIAVMEHIPGYQGVPYVANSLLVLVISFLCCLVGDKICRKIKIGRLNLSSVIGLK